MDRHPQPSWHFDRAFATYGNHCHSPHPERVDFLAINMGLPPAEYSPREVKLAVVGRGNASKDQVHFMVKNLLGLREDIKPDDASDALAVAICHYHRLNDKIRVK